MWRRLAVGPSWAVSAGASGKTAVRHTEQGYSPMNADDEDRSSEG